MIYRMIDDGFGRHVTWAKMIGYEAFFSGFAGDVTLAARFCLLNPEVA